MPATAAATIQATRRLEHMGSPFLPRILPRPFVHAHCRAIDLSDVHRPEHRGRRLREGRALVADLIRHRTDDSYRVSRLRPFADRDRLLELETAVVHRRLPPGAGYGLTLGDRVFRLADGE